MDFEPSAEQIQLHDSVSRLLADHGRFEQRRAATALEPGYDVELWRRLAGLGVAGLLVPEAHGGIGGRFEDLLPVLRATGRALSLEPLLASGVLAATTLRHAASPAQQATWLPGLASGEAVWAWAYHEAAGGHAACWVETHARQKDGAWLLDGRKSPVLHGAHAGRLLLSARVAGQPGDAQGLAWFAVEPDAPGLARRAFRLVDDTPAAELHLQATPAQPLGDPFDAPRAAQALVATHDAALAALCADMLGTLEAAYDLAIGYLGTRRQFGRPIGDNQALRHEAAEMRVALELCRSMAIAAAVAADRPAQDASRTDLLQAKLVIGRRGRALCHAAIQLHGGIGMTEEYAVGHCLRRLHVRDHLFGDSAAQAERLASGTPT